MGNCVTNVPTPTCICASPAARNSVNTLRAVICAIPNSVTIASTPGNCAPGGYVPSVIRPSITSYTCRHLGTSDFQSMISKLGKLSSPSETT